MSDHDHTPGRPAALAVELTENRKTGPLSATYATQSSCPRCPFLASGCYAEHGPVSYVTRRLNAAGPVRPLEAAKQEARAIDGLTGRHDLRLHVVGDARTDKAAATLAAAAGRYLRRALRFGRAPAVFTFTHAWHKVRRESWGPVSVLASCESLGQAARAFRRGYAAAVVLPADAFAGRKFFAATVGGEQYRVVRCPNELDGRQCVDCRLCMKDDLLRSRRVLIGFTPHGAGAGRVNRRLPLPTV